MMYDIPFNVNYVVFDGQQAEEISENCDGESIDSIVENDTKKEDVKKSTMDAPITDFRDYYDDGFMQYSFPDYKVTDDYLKEFLQRREDFTEMVPLKFLHIEPKSIMGGVLGYTYLGENFMARREDLYGETARMVDIHESIHTPDEYETRVITSWIMERQERRYIK
ncbi:MAG: hypothetical protein Q8R37_01020 [Nanoarchaeota archaeon]|nr:hypothetical protein [Nanoarchaeota archaeon]